MYTQNNQNEEKSLTDWLYGQFLSCQPQLLFATNAATLIGGTLVGQHVQMRIAATFVYSFIMTVRYTSIQ